MNQEPFSFSEALKILKAGGMVTRLPWLKDTVSALYLVHGSSFKVDREPLLGILKGGKSVNYQAHIDIIRGGEFASTWTPTNQDLLENDWIQVDHP